MVPVSRSTPASSARTWARRVSSSEENGLVEEDDARARARGLGPGPRAAARRRRARGGSGPPGGPAAPGRAPRRRGPARRWRGSWSSPKRHVAGDGQVREQRVVLEHQPDLASLGRHEPAGAARPASPASRTEPASGRSRPATSRSRVDLPQPGRADEGHDAARARPGGRASAAATVAPYALATPVERDGAVSERHGPGLPRRRRGPAGTGAPPGSARAPTISRAGSAARLQKFSIASW